MGLFDFIPGLGPIMNIIGGIGGIASGNQLGQQGTGNWDAAGNAIYQPQYTGAADTAYWNSLQKPTQGYSAISKLLNDLQNPNSAQGSALLEQVRSGQADRGLSTSPLGSVLESSAMVPAMSNAISGAAGQLQGMDMQKLQALMQYLTTGIGAGQARGNLLSGLGKQQVDMGMLLGSGGGSALNAGLGGLNSIFGTNPNLSSRPNPYAERTRVRP